MDDREVYNLKAWMIRQFGLFVRGSVVNQSLKSFLEGKENITVPIIFTIQLTPVLKEKLKRGELLEPQKPAN